MGGIAWGAGFLASSAQASEELPFFIRVAILRDAPTLEKALLTLSQRDYHGTIRVVANKRGCYDAVNILDIEDYLLGVIGREMNPGSPLEALKAQAIAARSHALFMARAFGNQRYDLIANLSQAYLGKDKLSKNVVLAIEITRGQVIQCQGKTIPVYFHASCGGHTETEASIWETSAKAWKKGGMPTVGSVVCPYCVQSSNNKWSLEISTAAFQQAMKRAGFTIGASPFVTIVEKAPGGHALKIAVRSETGNIQLDADRFRSILGYLNLKSTWFEVRRRKNPDETKGDTLVFEGNGFGHGVGLCQFGAEQMAREGASCERILTYYYPNCSVTSCGSGELVSAK